MNSCNGDDKMRIYSKWDEKDLLKLSALNSVAQLYELLGIYETFKLEGIKTEFERYYNENVGKRPWHFRNIGEKKIKESLDDVSRCEIRLLSRTYRNIPVITSDKMGSIFTEVTKQVMNENNLKNVLSKMNIIYTPRNFLYFQYYLVSNYVHTQKYAGSFKKKKVFRAVLEEWEANTIFETVSTY